MRHRSKHFDELKGYIEQVPLIDCHDHSYKCEPRYEDPLHIFLGSYYEQDLVTAIGVEKTLFVKDFSEPFEKRWEVFERGWKKSCHTGYARVIRLLLKRFYDVDEVSYESIASLKGRLLELGDESVFESILEEAGIAVRLQDLGHIPESVGVLDGQHKLTPRSRVVIPLPRYHRITSGDDIAGVFPEAVSGISSLEDYLQQCYGLFCRYRDFGAAGFKDQSAYTRTLDYENATRGEAESVFNMILSEPRKQVGYPDQAKPLDDYLFQEFMRMAGELGLPVQLHTGHMAAVSNEITKANAVKLIPLVEMHKQVRFDLLHANWPFGGEVLYMAKNFPNVTVNFAWANIIDPVYCVELFKQALSSVPHGKVHAYGSDYCGMVDRSWSHARITRDNVTMGLCEMVEKEYLGLEQAKQVAADWFFNNANEYFKLGFERFSSG